MGLGVLGLVVSGLGVCKCVRWIYELTVDKQITYWCTIQLCVCKSLISLRMNSLHDTSSGQGLFEDLEGKYLNNDPSAMTDSWNSDGSCQESTV